MQMTFLPLTQYVSSPTTLKLGVQHFFTDNLTCYRVIPGHRNWHIKTAVWNLAGFLHFALETRWQRFGLFLDDFLNSFLYKNLNFLCENLGFFL